MNILREYIKLLVEAPEDSPVRQPFDIPIPKDLQDIHSRMKYAGRELYLVGGAVRDALMGKSPKDYDVATNASPEEVIKILQKDTKLKLDLTGKSFGVVRVKTQAGSEYEIATFREDIGKGKGTSVKFSTIENDVQRRDLTINALFYDMDSGEVVDYVGGLEDIENGIIRAVGDPGLRFDEDRVRILRAVRFAGRMGSSLDSATKQAILEDNALIDTETGAPIPGDRITEEFIKGIKSAQDVSHFLSLVQELKLFDQILPGLDVELSEFGSQDHIAQIAALLKNNPPDLVVPALQRMRYSNNDAKTISFLLRLINLNRETAAKLKKDFKRLNLDPDHLENFAEITGTPSEAKVRGFLEFTAAPLARDPKELIAQGLEGPEIGLAMAKAEAEAYLEFMGEVRKYVRILLHETNEYGWSVSSKKNMLLDKEGMEQEDKDNQEEYLKSMALMEISLGQDLANSIAYTALVLDPASHQKLAAFAPSGWKLYAHHMTIINPANHKQRLPSHWLGEELCIKIIGIAQSAQVVTALVDLGGVPLPMKGPAYPHVTIATLPPSKPSMSNWKFKPEIGTDSDQFKAIDSILICGTIEEVLL